MNQGAVDFGSAIGETIRSDENPRILEREREREEEGEFIIFFFFFFVTLALIPSISLLSPESLIPPTLARPLRKP